MSIPPGDQLSSAAIEQRLIDFLEGVTPHSAARLRPDSPIFATGLFDSLALVHLLSWVESETGVQIDPARLDFQTEWATIAHIAAFVDRARGRALRDTEASTGGPDRDERVGESRSTA